MAAGRERRRVQAFGPRRAPRVSSARGYTLIDTMMTLGLMGVAMAMAVVNIGSAQSAYKGDGGMRVILAQLNTAREWAITQRRQMQVTYVAPNQIQISRLELAGTTTLLSTVTLESGVQYALISGVPDTPDGFGISASPYFGTATKTIFNTDGTLIDQTGNPVNGSIYLAIPQNPNSLRAITILGGTGRVRAYRWDGTRWNLV